MNCLNFVNVVVVVVVIVMKQDGRTGRWPPRANSTGPSRISTSRRRQTSLLLSDNRPFSPVEFKSLETGP